MSGKSAVAGEISAFAAMGSAGEIRYDRLIHKFAVVGS